jgi:hypothetical protein
VSSTCNIEEFMKSTVRFNSQPVTVVFIFLIVGSAHVRSDNTCECQRPPGGLVRCEPGQVPFCNVVNGRVVAECKTPPRHAGTSAAAFNLWFASTALGRQVTPADLEKKEVKAELAKRYPRFEEQIAAWRDEARKRGGI